MAPRWGLIADDLTGACDAGVQFAKHGFPTNVWPSEEGLRTEPGTVAAVSTNTRRATAEQARARTIAACRTLAGLGARVVYAKIDSTFQGHPGVQISALMEGCGFQAGFGLPGVSGNGADSQGRPAPCFGRG